MYLILLNLKNQLRKNLPLYLLMTAVFALLFVVNVLIIKVIEMSVAEDAVIHMTSNALFLVFCIFVFYFIMKIYFDKLWRQYEIWRTFGAKTTVFYAIVAVDFLLTMVLGIAIGTAIDYAINAKFFLDGENHVFLTGSHIAYAVGIQVVLALFYFVFIFKKLNGRIKKL